MCAAPYLGLGPDNHFRERERERERELSKPVVTCTLHHFVLLSFSLGVRDMFKCCRQYSQVNQMFESKIAIVFLSINLNICFGCFKESSH